VQAHTSAVGPELAPVNGKIRRVELSVEKQLKFLLKRVVEVLPSENELAERIKRKRKLRVKFGIDPTSPDLTLGHTVVLQKLRDFQDAGHTAVLIFGDFTGMVGDPTGRKKARPNLSLEQARENAKTYLEQAGRVIDLKRAEIRYNSEWLSKLTMKECIELCSQMTVARMLEREDLGSRFRENIPIYIHEFLYALLQGYDSVAVKADVELGATEQKFNLLVGRQLMEHYGLEPQIVMTLPILVGTDGVKKMSASEGNYIAILDKPTDMFGKIMSIPDTAITNFFWLLTEISEDELERMKLEIEKALSGKPSTNPMEFKLKLAELVVERFWAKEFGEGIGKKEREKFLSAFSKREKRAIAKELKIPPHIIREGKVDIVHLLVEIGAVGSAREARRLLEEGAIRINGKKLAPHDIFCEIPEGAVLEVGKKKAWRIVQTTEM